MRIKIIQPFEDTIDYHAKYQCQYEKQHGTDDDGYRFALRVFHTDYKSKNDNADYVVNNSRAHNGGSGFGFQVAELFQRSHRDAYRGCRKDDTGKERRVKLAGAAWSETVIAAVEKITAS